MKTSLIACSLAFVCLFTADSTASEDYAAPAKNQFKKTSAQIATGHRSDVRKTRAWLRKALKVVRSDLASGELRPTDAHAALGAVSSKWYERMRDATSAALGDLEGAAVQRLVDTGGLSGAPAIQMGSNGTLDRALERMHRDHDIALRDARKRLGLVARKLRDNYGHALSVGLNELERPTVIPNIDGPTAQRQRATLDRVIGDGGDPALGDGMLKISGWKSDADMELTLRVERGAYVAPIVAVDTPDDDGAWFVTVPNLNAGNWRITLLRDGVPIAVTIASVAD